jgi:hypothetical protein
MAKNYFLYLSSNISEIKDFSKREKNGIQKIKYRKYNKEFNAPISVKG